MTQLRPANGASLFADVQRYHDFGIHRTGTSVDHATAAWMADRLHQLGLQVTSHDVGFDRWIGTSSLRAGETEVFHLAVPYEWQGSLDTNNVHVQLIDPAYGGFPDALDDAISAARSQGAEAAVLCTKHKNGSLVAVNRDLSVSPSNFPTVLAAGRDHEQLTRGPVHLILKAHTEPAKTVNVVATTHVAGDPIVITTPLTGWFGCAGERGTGVAVLLHLVEQFKHLPLVVVATGGHELTWCGAQQWVDTCTLAPRAVVHVGASVAAVEDTDAGGRQLASTRFALTSVGADAAADMATALEPARLKLRTVTKGWVGEGKAFSQLGAPLLSFSGAGVDFHCPEDTPERATSPDAMATVADAIALSVSHLLDAITKAR